jgi:hypothetical protein
MKITKSEIKNYEIAGRKYLAEYGLEDNLFFDHFGLQTLSREEYRDMKNYFIERGKFMGEITYHDRKMGVFLLGDDADKMELIEPHPGEIFLHFDCFVEHIAFRVPNLKTVYGLFEDRIISTFNIENTKGFEIQGPGQLIIEFRNNAL